ITEGQPAVTDLIMAPGGGIDEERLIALVGAIEQMSEHPLAEAIVRYAEERVIPLLTVEQFDSVTGQGAVGIVSGAAVIVGNERLMTDYSVNVDPLRPDAERLAEQGRTPIFVAI